MLERRWSSSLEGSAADGVNTEEEDRMADYIDVEQAKLRLERQKPFISNEWDQRFPEQPNLVLAV